MSNVLKGFNNCRVISCISHDNIHISQGWSTFYAQICTIIESNWYYCTFRTSISTAFHKKMFNCNHLPPTRFWISWYRASRQNTFCQKARLTEQSLIPALTTQLHDIAQHQSKRICVIQVTNHINLILKAHYKKTTLLT